MNLLDPDNRWLGLRRRDGTQFRGSLYDIVQVDVVDVTAVRPDFRGALYQLFIGLLQVLVSAKRIPVEEMDDWRQYWDSPPTPDELQHVLAEFRNAFDVVSDGPAFMQDMDGLSDGKLFSTAELLIDLGSDSNLFFNKKRTSWHGLCEECVAIGLFTLQTNAPSGGVGHRTSVRGGGPLTTLVVPSDPDASLWQRLWLNVLSYTSLDAPVSASMAMGTVFPWLQPTRVSDKAGVSTEMSDVNPLQAFFGMPRRIRVDSAATSAGNCEVCGHYSDTLYVRYRTRNYGTNYSGHWSHPLTPFAHDPSHQKPPLPFKGGRAAGGYQQWLALTFGEEATTQVAQVVRDYNRRDGKADYLGKRDSARLWCFGFGLDNMKAEAWHDVTLPLYWIASPNAEAFLSAARSLLGIAKHCASLLGDMVRDARGMSKKDPVVEQSFWQTTESGFYAVVQALAHQERLDDVFLAETFPGWLAMCRKQTLELFDYWVLVSSMGSADMKQIVQARSKLQKLLTNGKPFKVMSEFIKNNRGGCHEAESQSATA